MKIHAMARLQEIAAGRIPPVPKNHSIGVKGKKTPKWTLIYKDKVWLINYDTGKTLDFYQGPDIVKKIREFNSLIYKEDREAQ